MLASQVAARYGGQDCAIVGLSDGGVMVGAQIAVQLHAVLSMLLTENIDLPRELVPVAGVVVNGTFGYNRAYSEGEIYDIVSEYRGVIEQQKLEKLHNLHMATRGAGLIREDLLQNKHVILVDDGMPDGFLIDLALEYLKPISIRSLIVATPFASVRAVDRMHVLADDIYCLNVLEDYMSTDHYYDTRDVPSHEVIIDTIARIIGGWNTTPRPV